MVRRNKKLLYALLLYTVAFFMLWTLCETWLKSYLPLAQDEWFKEIILKSIIWTVPALLLIHKFSNRLTITLREMVTVRFRWKIIIQWALLFTAYFFIGSLLQDTIATGSENLTLLTLSTLLISGIGEEIVFRGWLLNATLKLLGIGKKWFAIAINAIMFLLVHLPLWIYSATVGEIVSNFGFLAILGLSVIFSVVFIKSRSIWPSTILHVWWNILVVMTLGNK